MGIVVTLISLHVQAYPGESIVLDPVTGNYTITYWDASSYEYNGVVTPPGLDKTIFVPATKITPTIHSKFKLKDTASIYYSYVLSNGRSAKQAIVGLSLEQVGQITNERPLPLETTANPKDIEKIFFANRAAIAGPENWSGNIVRFYEQSRVVWQPDELKTGGIRAGASKSGFGFSSSALPGINSAHMDGLSEVFGYTGDGPAMDSAINEKLEHLRKNDFVSRPAAIPAIAVPTPFNAAVLLDRIQTQMHTWIPMQLLDTNFSSQLDRYLVAAANAYRHNQPKAGKEHIQTLRKMLKKEHEDADKDDDKEDGKHDEKNDNKNKRLLIDRLAARVLDFDLKYVLKRMGDD